MTNIKIDNYGELIAKGSNGILWSYEALGGYQGDFIAIIEKNNELHIYKGQYGSCSGCDWLEGESEYESSDSLVKTLREERIADYMKDVSPFLVIAKENVPDTIEEFKTLLPANSRIWEYAEEDEYETKLENILKQLHTPQFKNLEYLEAKYDQKENAK